MYINGKPLDAATTATSTSDSSRHTATPNGRARHRLLRTLGRQDTLKASGQLDQLAASFAGLDPSTLDGRRDVGALLLVRHYLHSLGLAGIIDASAPMRGRATLTHGEVIATLVANRLSVPSPLYDIAGWAFSAARPNCSTHPPGCYTTTGSGRALEALARSPNRSAASCCLQPWTGSTSPTPPGCTRT
jgi:hypothetical protein